MSKVSRTDKFLGHLWGGKQSICFDCYEIADFARGMDKTLDGVRRILAHNLTPANKVRAIHKALDAYELEDA